MHRLHTLTEKHKKFNLLNQTAFPKYEEAFDKVITNKLLQIISDKDYFTTFVWYKKHK